jgi:hypothetical protein
MKKSFTFLSILLLFFGGFSLLSASTVNETEPNNSEGTANPIALVFSGNSSQDTIKASINPGGETDYFSVTLPGGYYYLIDAELFDAYNLSQGTYTVDAKFYYKIGNGDWEGSFDDGETGIFIMGPATIYFRVNEYWNSATETGTYALNLKTQRSTINYTTLSLDFVSDVANDTTKADISASGEIDFYQVILPAGFNYSIDASVFDATPYTCDVKFAYKIGNGVWSSTYDFSKSNIITGPATVYFMVQSYYTGNTGTYALYLKVNRKTGNYLSVDNVYLNLSSELNDTTVKVTCTGDWAASSNKAWLTVNTPSGSGNGVLTFTASANSSLDSRSGYITVTSTGADPVSIYVYQDPYVAPDSYEPNNSEVAYSIFQVPAFVNNQTIVSTNNANIHLPADVDYYKFRLTDGYKYLVKLNLYDDDNTSVYTGDAYLYSKHANGSFSSFNNAFICNGKDSVMLMSEYDGDVGTYRIDVNITRFTGDLLQADQNYITYTKDARTYNYINVYSTTSWTVETNQTWVTLGSTSGSGMDDFYFNVEANSGAARTATITLKATGVNDVVITIYQEGNNILADKYETNDTEGAAYNVAINYAFDKASFGTTEANIHSSSDLDYYKVVLPAGYNYTIISELFDSWNGKSPNRYSIDAQYSYKINSGAWSSIYDDSEAGEIKVNNGGTVYFKVEDYNTNGDTGTYLLQLNIERSIITGMANLNSEKSFNVYPNPSNGSFNLAIADALNSDVKIKITNLNGRVVYNTSLSKSYGDNTFGINTNLPAGIYVLEMVANGAKMVKRIIITK